MSAPLPEHVVAAIALALEGAATPETALEVIKRLIDKSGPLDPMATLPVALFLDTVRELGGTFAVNQK